MRELYIILRSFTYGEVSILDIVQILKNSNKQYKVIVGSDSQEINHQIKLVTTIVLREEGKGGLFFYDVFWLPQFNSLRHKIFTEVNYSIQYATELASYPEINHIDIHLDVGTHGPTKNLIKELSGWVISSGFGCEIKPNSFVASSVANRISK